MTSSSGRARHFMDAEQEDEAMKPGEEEPAQELDLLVKSDAETNMQVFDDARREDQVSCSCHSSQVQQTSPSNADETAHEDEAIEQSKEPAQEVDKPVMCTNYLYRGQA